MIRFILVQNRQGKTVYPSSTYPTTTTRRSVFGEVHRLIAP